MGPNRIPDCSPLYDRIRTRIFCTSPIGDIMIEGCPNGLHSVGQVGFINDQNFNPNSDTKVELISIQGPENNIPAQTCFKWLKQYFQNPNDTDKIPLPALCLPPFNKVSFRQKVWIILANNVGPGQVVSYGELAAMASSPKAALAVGTSMHHNPFQIIVPCHRVIRSDDTLGNYAGGTGNSIKEWLLAHECVIPSSS